MIRFSFVYAGLALLLFLTEVFIGAYLHDSIIRPYGGDFLVVILIYCFVKTFINTPVISTAIGVLVFSYLIEISQYYHLVDAIGLGHSKIARIILGTSFSFVDLLSYTLGILLVVIVEKLIRYGKANRA